MRGSGAVTPRHAGGATPPFRHHPRPDQAQRCFAACNLPREASRAASRRSRKLQATIPCARCRGLHPWATAARCRPGDDPRGGAGLGSDEPGTMKAARKPVGTSPRVGCGSHQRGSRPSCRTGRRCRGLRRRRGAHPERRPACGTRRRTGSACLNCIKSCWPATSCSVPTPSGRRCCSAGDTSLSWDTTCRRGAELNRVEASAGPCSRPARRCPTAPCSP